MTDNRAAALLKHVLVLDRIAHRRHVLHEDSLGPDKFATPAETAAQLGARSYKDFRGDAHHLGGDLFAEVPFACECGHRLEQGPAVAAWAHHAAKETGLSETALLRHGVAHLRGTPATATCDCGRDFIALVDPHDPGEALARWASHVEAVG